MDHITLEDIDFESVKKCSDSKVLIKYIQLLKADGGYFQELLRACEERLKQVDPKLAQKLAPQKLLPETVNESRALLLQWESELRSSASTATPQTSGNLAPLRNGTLPTPKVDKVDADLTLEEQHEAELNSHQQELKTEVSDHDAEITKGLEALKAGDADEAEYFFTRAIQAATGQSPRGFFHRAEARTALEKHREALEDIQTAMALDVSLGSTGGFAIRASLRAEAGFFDEAEADFIKAIEAAKTKADVEKLEGQLRLLRVKAKAQVFTKISIIEEDEEEPKIVEIFDDDKKPETFTKITVIEETTETTKRRIPVEIVDE